MKSVFVFLAAVAGASPAFAQDIPPASPVDPLLQPAPPPVPVQPAPAPVIIPRDWSGVFDAIDRGNWASAQAGISVLGPSPLAALAKAELYTARNSPTVDLASILALLAEAPELPHAQQLAAMAVRRGATTQPSYFVPRRTAWLGSAPVRTRATPVRGDPSADQFRPLLDEFVDTNDAAGAEAQLMVYAPSMTLEGRAEAGQRVAFIYYILGLDLDARRVAETWRQGATGEWAAQSAWVTGLASWRISDFNNASQAFQQAARLTSQRELRSGA